MTLLFALRPVDGLDWDWLSYHLAAPKIYLAEGRIVEHHSPERFFTAPESEIARAFMQRILKY